MTLCTPQQQQRQTVNSKTAASWVLLVGGQPVSVTWLHQVGDKARRGYEFKFRRRCARGSSVITSSLGSWLRKRSDLEGYCVLCTI